MTDIKLKPCKCGHEAIVLRLYSFNRNALKLMTFKYVYRATCTYCGRQTDAYDTEERAAEDWNKWYGNKEVE